MSQTSSVITLSPWLKGIFYLAIFTTQLMGLLNFPFDYKKKKFLPNCRWNNIYCGLLHLCYCGLLPFAITSPYIDEAAYKQKRFYVALNNAISALRLPALLFTLWGVWRHSGSLFRVIYDFEKLRLENFHTLSESKRKEILLTNDRLVWLKLMTSFSLITMFYMRIFIFVKNPTWQFIWLSVYFGTLESLTIFNMNFFFCGMCYANCALRYVEAELTEFGAQLDVERIHHLAKIFGEICKLIKELAAIYQWKLLAIWLAAMVSLIALFFSLIIWWYTSIETFKYPILLLALQTAFVNIGDIVLIGFVCSNTKVWAENIQQLLFELTERQTIRSSNILKNNLNHFSLKVSVQLENVNLCRLVDLELQTAFDFMKAMIAYLIILVQFDLKTK